MNAGPSQSESAALLKVKALLTLTLLFRKQGQILRQLAGIGYFFRHRQPHMQLLLQLFKSGRINFVHIVLLLTLLSASIQPGMTITLATDSVLDASLHST